MLALWKSGCRKEWKIGKKNQTIKKDRERRELEFEYK